MHNNLQTRIDQTEASSTPSGQRGQAGQANSLGVEDPNMVTERDHEVYAMESIASRLPVVFGDKKMTYTKISGNCGDCAGQIPDAQLRGRVDRSFTDVAVVEAVGVCLDCRRFTRFSYRLYSDGRFACRQGNTWKTWHMRKTSALKLYFNWAWRRMSLFFRP